MSKGSKQRDSQVSQAEYNQAWDMIFKPTDITDITDIPEDSKVAKVFGKLLNDKFYSEQLTK